MAKYLIISKEKDFVSSSKSAKKHAFSASGKVVMVYNVAGDLVDSSRKQDDGTIVRYGTKLADGAPRIWAEEFLKNHKIGDSVPDAEDWYYKEFLPKQQSLKV